ncbi:hypothetical protein BGZ76_004325 [Entomortierella beljakovae]|nr:hypothetical protein BGZ76_004325 [Entomortierella beljakovae]
MKFLAIILIAIVVVGAVPVPVLVGNNVQHVGVTAQNLNNNIGNQQAAVSHSQGIQNNPQQNNPEQSTVEILKNLDK